MATSATIQFLDEHTNTPVVSIYHHYDGYIEGIGHDLAKFLNSKKLLKGFGLDTKMDNGYANGMGCLIAQYIKENKTGIGGLYILNHQQEEYNYIVSLVNGKFQIEVGEFKGSPDELLQINNHWCKL